MRTDKEFLNIANDLSDFHDIFSQLWLLGKPTLTDKIRSAAVAWDKEGVCISFMFNPEFYDKLKGDDLSFVVAHECLHVILGHGRRLRGMDKEIGNIAADITINEMLISYFGIKPSTFLTEDFGICTIKSIFKDEARKIERNREFEYYYAAIMKDPKLKGALSGGDAMTLDSHEFLFDDVPSEVRDLIEKMADADAKELKENLGKDGQKDEEVGKARGEGSAFTWIKARLMPKANEDWRKVIQDWTIREFRERNKTQWKHTNRRFMDFQKRNPRLVIPSIGPLDHKFADRIDMTFFMDVSGSCYNESQSFFAAAKTIPDDKFIIDAYAFDTEITPIDISSDTMPYGGGTSFHQLEEHCRRQPEYPSVVFVLTDGYGTNVVPQHPERWIVFLTPNGSRGNFPEGVRFFEFKDFDPVQATQ